MKKAILLTVVSFILFAAGFGIFLEYGTFTNPTEEEPISLTRLIINDKEMALTGDSDIKLEYTSEKQCFAVVTNGWGWFNDVWYLEFDGKQIVKKQMLDYTGSVIKSDVAQLSQGTYLVLYTSSHMGNGDIELVNPKTLKTDYTFPLYVDRYHEGYVSDEVMKTYHLTGTNYGYSFVYNEGYLNPNYADLNGDGKTDITFIGVKELKKDGPDLTYSIPVHFYFENQIYLFDAAKNQFVLNEKMSSEKLIN